jgi:tetratricopeptide (TPR) repeat protein
MDGISNKQALEAAESAFAIEQNHFWGAVTLARLRAAADKPRDALDAAHAAVEAAKGPREKAVAQVEYGDANLRIGRVDVARQSYKSAIDATRTLARSGEARAQHDLSVCLNKLGDLEVQAKDAAAAKTLFEEDLTIARHLAQLDPQSVEAQRDVIISLVKLAEVSGDKNHWVEASQLASALSKSGRMPQSDVWMVDALRKQAAAVQQPQ